MRLHELGPTRSIRARWMLQEPGIDFEAVPVNLPAGEHRGAEFRAINPAGKIPVLVDEGWVLTESVAIVLYLAEKYPQRGLLPVDLRERGDAYRWVLFAVTELEQPPWRIARHTSLYPPEERLPADVTLAQREFRAMAAVLEQHMRGRKFVAGSAMSTADIIGAYTLDWGQNYDSLEHCPHLRAYLERMYARPAAPRRIAELLRELRAAVR